MKQILQDLKTGSIILAEIPTPKAKSGNLLIKTTKTLISLGTERMLLEFGKASYLKKAQQQPDKVKQVINKIKTDGLKPTVNAVLNKLDQPMPLGYSNVGIVVDVGNGVSGFKVGDRVLSNGHHAEFVSVPQNLCALIPHNVTDNEAAFAVAGSIAIQGVRLTNPTIGETVVVVGLGLIGILTAQILKANGCNVIAYDFMEDKVILAKQFGIDAFHVNEFNDPVLYVEQQTNQNGADAVIITASTPSNLVISQSAKMSRKRGRVVLVGVVGLNLSRADFFEKELTFQVSCSYGPGRYDNQYEKKGFDYPIAFVRWTEQRNFEAVLNLMATNRIQTLPLVTKTIKLSEAPLLYDDLSEMKKNLGIIIDFSDSIASRQTLIKINQNTKAPSNLVVGFIGAGNFATSTLLPLLQKTNANLHTIVSSTGVTSYHHGKKNSFSFASSDADDILKNEDINTVFISTPHNTHGMYVLDAINKNKNVFVEKPLCLTLDELIKIKEAIISKDQPPKFYVGFNRRFSPFIQKIKKLLKTNPAPISMIMTVNSGHIPSNHWTQDVEIGGGRLVGEGCHFIDLLRFISDSQIESSSVSFMNKKEKDVFTISMKFKNGSIGTIHYFSNGHKSFSKERLEIFSNNKIIVLDNFKKLKTMGFNCFNLPSVQDKGHKNEIDSFLNDILNNTQSMPLEEIFEVTEHSIILSNQV